MADGQKAAAPLPPDGAAEEVSKKPEAAEREEGEITPQKEAAAAAEKEQQQPSEAAAAEEGPKRHPLEHRWTLWFDNPSEKKKNLSDWGASLRSVYTFGTVEEFWCLYNNILPPSKLMMKADLHCFKEGIQPKWEDPKCAQGGSWVASTKNKPSLDNYWLHTLLAMIGEQFDDGDDICGAVASIRNINRLALWTKTADNESLQMRIGRQWKDILDLSDNQAVGYNSFAEAQKAGKKDRYSV